MTFSLDRRALIKGALLATSAMAVGTPTLALGDGPDGPNQLRIKLSKALGRQMRKGVLSGSVYKKAVPAGGYGGTYTAGPASARSYASKAASDINALARQRAATRAATVAERKAIVGLASGLARGGALAGRVLNWAGIGLTLWYVGSAAYNFLFGAEGGEQAAKCLPGTYCRRLQSNGAYKVEATTTEWTTTQSSWSLSASGLWYPYANQYVGAVAATSVPGHYLVNWVFDYTKKANGTFDPSTDYQPYVTGTTFDHTKAAIDAKTQVATAALTDTQVAELLEPAVAALVQLLPDALGEFATAIAAGAKLNLAGFAEGINATVSDLFNALSPSGDGGYDLLDPLALADGFAADVGADENWFTPGTTSGGNTGGNSSSGGGTSDGNAGTPVNYGNAVEPDEDITLPGWPEISGPLLGLFTPVLTALDPGQVACPALTVPGWSPPWGHGWSAFPMNYHCQLFEPLRGGFAALSAGAGAIRAVFIVADA